MVSTNVIPSKLKTWFKQPTWRLWLVLGVLLITLSASQTYLRGRALQFNVPQPVIEQQQERQFPVRLNIEEVADVSLQSVSYESGWPVSDSQAQVIEQGAALGEAGNMVIYGHNTQAIFGGLKQAKVGNDIIVYDSQGNALNYTVEKIIEVDPSEISWLESTSEAVLTIYTCSGWLDSKRLIVRAKPSTVSTTS